MASEPADGGAVHSRVSSTVLHDLAEIVLQDPGSPVTVERTLRRLGEQKFNASIGGVSLSSAPWRWTWSVSTVSLWAVWGLLSFLALAAQILSDVFQGSAPQYPLKPILWSSTFLTCLCACLSVWLGHDRWFPHFSVFQPFAGGERFVVYQAFGWSVLVTCGVLNSVYALADHGVGHRRYGFLSLVGCFAVVANTVLISSVAHFDVTCTRARGCRHAAAAPGQSGVAPGRLGASRREILSLRGLLRLLSSSPNRETALVLVLMAAQLLVSYVGVGSARAARPAAIVGLGFLVLNGLMIHFGIGWMWTPGYRLFMPIQHSVLATLEQVVFWVLYSCALYAAVWLVHETPDVPPLAFGLQALTSVLGVSSLLMFVRTNQFDGIAPERSLIAEYGGFVLSVTAVVMGGFTVGVAVLFRLRFDEAAGAAGSVLSPETPGGGLLLCQTLSAVFLLLLPPCTHLTGRVIFGDRFDFFQPFRGSVPFVTLQALGWTCFGLSVLYMTLHITAVDFGSILVSTALSVLAQLLIHASIQVYQRATHPAEKAEAAASPGVAVGQSSPRGQRVDGPSSPPAEPPTASLGELVSGEMITSYILALASIILRLVVDMSAIWVGSVSVPSSLLLLISMALFAMCVPLAHVSGRSRGIPIFRPFSGSGTYVALQALGWTAYAMVLLTSFVVVFLQLNDVNMERAHSKFWFTLEGILHLAPLTLISLSVVVESRSTMSNDSKRQLLVESFAELRGYLERVALADASLSDVKKGELCMALYFLADSAFAHVEIPMAEVAPLTRSCVQDSSQSFSSEQESEEESLRSSGRRCTWPSSDLAGGSIPSTKQPMKTTAFSVDTRTQQGSATILIVLLCLASSMAYGVSAVFSATAPTLGAAFATIGFTITTVSCVALHTLYGIILHGKSGSYYFFMPFKGGPMFVALQTVGWVTYSGTVIVTLVSVLEPEGYPLALLLGACLSISSQLCILGSIPKFNEGSATVSYLEQNAEGVVALLAFAGAFVFSHLYSETTEFFFLTSDKAHGRHAERRGGGPVVTADLHYADVYMADAISFRQNRVPFVVAALSMAFSVPLILIGTNRLAHRSVAAYAVVRRPRRGRSHAEQKSTEDQHVDLGDEERKTVRTTTGEVVANLLQIAAMLSMASVPLLVFFAVYYVSYSYDAGIARTVRVWWPPFMVFLIGILALSAVPSIQNLGFPSRFLCEVRCTAVACSMYSIVSIAALGSYAPLLLLPFSSIGAVYTAASMTGLTVFGSIKRGRQLIRMAAFSAIGYVVYQQYHRLALLGFSRAFCATLHEAVIDVAILGLWLWYLPLYHGAPHETGGQRSAAFVSYARRHMFAEVSRYFNFRIIVDNPDRVHMRDPKNQYLFSFHPHGVFPGTALFASLTEEWEKKVGSNEQTHVSTHGASVIFNIPMVRDFNLRLGARAVTRSAIERSLGEGNSVLIVTGGQAEMLLTDVSALEMHLVTHHTGFLRLAMKRGVPLVPLLCFAENNVINLVHFPYLQRLTLRLLGFPLPMIPHGRWYLPLPNQTPLTLVVGEPVVPVAGATGDDSGAVQEMADRYFAELKRIFYKHREAAGYPAMELHLHAKKGRGAGAKGTKGEVSHGAGHAARTEQ